MEGAAPRQSPGPGTAGRQQDEAAGAGGGRETPGTAQLRPARQLQFPPARGSDGNGARAVPSRSAKRFEMLGLAAMQRITCFASLLSALGCQD